MIRFKRTPEAVIRHVGIAKSMRVRCVNKRQDWTRKARDPKGKVEPRQRADRTKFRIVLRSRTFALMTTSSLDTKLTTASWHNESQLSCHEEDNCCGTQNCRRHVMDDLGWEQNTEQTDCQHSSANKQMCMQHNGKTA